MLADESEGFRGLMNCFWLMAAELTKGSVLGACRRGADDSGMIEKRYVGGKIHQLPVFIRRGTVARAQEQNAVSAGRGWYFTQRGKKEVIEDHPGV